MVCMSTSPFDAGFISEWFSSGTSEDTNGIDVFLEQIARHVDATPSVSSPSAATQLTTSIPVMVGADIAELSVPIDLLCALLLTKNRSSEKHGSPCYTLEDVMEASENLKRFREVSSVSSSSASDHVGSSRESSPPILPTPDHHYLNQGIESLPHPSPVDIVGLSMDGSGAVVVQEMLLKANDLEKELIFCQLMENCVLVSANTHGCRVMQRILDYGTQEQNVRLFKSIPYYKLADLCIDVNGNHVMQKFVEVLPQSALGELIDVLVNDIVSSGQSVARLSLHSYGCRVVQRLLVKTINPGDRSVLLNCILEIFPQLVSDQFGNYVAQHAIDYSTESEKVSILNILGKMDIHHLCCNKFASNVVEKAVRIKYLKSTSAEQRLGANSMVPSKKPILLALHKLISTISQNEDTLLFLMKDKYGNYVIKAICDLNPIEFPQVTYVKDVLVQNAALLKSYTYGFHLVDRIEKSSSRRDPIGSNLSDDSRGRRTRCNSQQL